MRGVLVGCAAVLGAVGLAVGGLLARFETMSFDAEVAVPGRRVWGHRGLAMQVPENSLAAVREALAAGASGIEIDAFFDDEAERFLISHDPPEPDGAYPALEDVLRELPDGTHLWLDLKNLDHGNRDGVIARLDRLTAGRPIQRWLFVESEHGQVLRQVAAAGYLTLYQIEPDGRRSWGGPARLRAKLLIALSGFAGISTSASHVARGFFDGFEHVPLFVSTAPGEADLAWARGRDNVKVVLTDSSDYHPF